VSATHSAAVRTRRRAWIAWTAVAVIWGTTFLFIKIALHTIPPFVLGGTRYVVGGTALATFLRARGRRLPAPAEWRPNLLLGFLMFVLGNGGVAWSEQYLSSGLTAVVVGTNPFWMVGVNALMSDDHHLRPRQWIGLAIGFSGIVTLVWPDISFGGRDGRMLLFGVLALQIGAIGWAIGSSYTRRRASTDLLGSAAQQMIFGGILMLLIGGALGEWTRVSLTPRTTVALVYLTFVGAVVAFVAYSYALKHLSIAVVSLYTYVNPVIAVSLGVWLLGEAFHTRMILAAVIIFSGILVVGPTQVAPADTK
jgi:drug/metabolite transporter (DMT)-like permease